MTRSLIATIGALGIAATAFAQTPTPTPSPTTPPAAIAAMEDIKITGCLKSGVDANSFELKRSKKDQGAATAAAASDKGLKLVASAGVDLASHVGHQVELTGSWAAPAAAAAPTAKTFTVSNLKMVSATCTAGTN